MKKLIFRSPHRDTTETPAEECYSKNEIGEYLVSNGFDPAEFLYFYLLENNSENPTGGTTFRRCYFEDLPEDLECFFCRAQDKSVIYDYHRYREPRISKREVWDF